MKACFFCGEKGKRTREHAIPRWLRKPLADEPRWEGGTWLRSSSPPDRSRALWRRRTDAVLRRVCERCNSGWMSRLESDARPLLLPLIAGETIRITNASRTVLLRWALKTAAVLGPLHRAPDAVSPELRRRLALGEDLGDEVALWAVPIAPDEPSADDWRTGFDHDDNPGAPSLNITGIVLGRIAFEVVNLNWAEMPLDQIPAITPTRFQRIAPASGADLLPSPSAAPSTMAAAGVPFKLRITQVLHLAVEAGLVKPPLAGPDSSSGADETVFEPRGKGSS
jgi:hypothetical protein